MRCQAKLKNSIFRCKRDCLRGKYCWQHKQSGGRRRQSGGSSRRRQSTSSRKQRRQSTSSRRKRRQSGGSLGQIGGGLDDKIKCTKNNEIVKCEPYTFQSNVCQKNLNRRKSGKVYKCQKKVNNNYECQQEMNTNMITDYYCPNIEYKLKRYEPIETSESKLPFVIGPEIGSGGWGVIHLAKTMNNDTIIIKQPKLIGDKIYHQGIIDSLINEMTILRYLNNEKQTDCIVKPGDLYYTIDTKSYYLVIEYLGKAHDTYQNIRDMIDSFYDNSNPRPKINYHTLITIMTNIASCVKRLHDLGIVHFDLNPGNIMINLKNNKVKIIDFGASCYRDGCQNNMAGALGYIPPDFTLSIQPHDFNTIKKRDIWILGMIYYDIIYGDSLLIKSATQTPAQTSAETIAQIYIKNDYIINDPNSDQYLHKFIDESFRTTMNDPMMSPLLKNMIIRDPQQRYNIDQVLSDLKKLGVSQSKFQFPLYQSKSKF